MDEEIYKRIANSIEKYKHGPQILRILNTLTTAFVYITYPIFLFRLWLNKDPRFWKLVLIPGISFVLLSIFRSYVDRPRPYEVYNIIPILNKDTKGNSFPSRHVFSVFVIAMTLYYISQGLGITLMLIGLLIGIIRVLGGVHFPRDVIFGAIIGILSSIIGWNINMF